MVDYQQNISVEEHVRLGDIVVSDMGGVVQYDFGKEVATTTVDETTVAFIHKNPPRPPCALLLESVGLLEVAEIDGDRPWIDHIANTLKRLNILRPPAETDILASSDDPKKLIDHPHDPSRIDGQPRLFTGTIASANIVLKNPLKRDSLRDQFGVKAVEMEGSGIADASWKVGVGYLVVRGICDYCDSKKGDDWQKYAAIVAAGYVRALIESMPSPPTRTEGKGEETRGAITQSNADQYLQAVKTFAETNPYLALGELLAEEDGSTIDSYVPLVLQPNEPKTEDEKRPLVLSAVLNEERYAPYVLFVGAGGAGKSTLIRQIARHAWESPALIGLEKRYLPMIIRLSAFAATGGIAVEKKLKEAMNRAGELSLLHDLP